MNVTRHSLAKEPLELESSVNILVTLAESLENAGNWYLAGEKYTDAAEQVLGTSDETRAKLFVRAATAFEIACQPRAASLAYSQAAAVLERTGIQFVAAGELYNRAALHLRNLDEYFSAGTCWRRAAEAFAKASESVLSNLDNLHPVPSQAGKFTVSGMCYTAAGDAFQMAGDEAMWACGAYWEAGKSHSTQGNSYHAFVAYRKALTATARFYGTHDREQLRRCLPLSEQERAEKLDPLSVLEQSAYQGNHIHQSRNSGMLTTKWAQSQTEHQMIATYHEFALTFADIGNGAEAAVYRALEKEHTRRSMLVDCRYGPAVLYWIWANTSGYGESLFRWAFTCIAVLLSFSLLYAVFGLVDPIKHWFDYFYFSVVTFTSLGYGDIHPIGVAGKAVACIEIVSGLVMFGILLTFISSRFQRS